MPGQLHHACTHQQRQRLFRQGQYAQKRSRRAAQLQLRGNGLFPRVPAQLGRNMGDLCDGKHLDHRQKQFALQSGLGQQAPGRLPEGPQPGQRQAQKGQYGRQADGQGQSRAFPADQLAAAHPRGGHQQQPQQHSGAHRPKVCLMS